VRPLAAALLIGAVLLIVALVRQGAAIAQPLTVTPQGGAGGDGASLGTPGSQAVRAEPRALPPDQITKSLYAEYVDALVASRLAVLDSSADLPAPAGGRNAGEHSTPGPASSAALQWLPGPLPARPKIAGELVVAEAAGQPEPPDNWPKPGTSAPAGVTVDETSKAPPRQRNSSNVYHLTAEITGDAHRLSTWMQQLSGTPRIDLDRIQSALDPAQLRTWVEKHAMRIDPGSIQPGNTQDPAQLLASAQKHAGAANVRVGMQGVPVSDQTALQEIKAAAADLRALSALAEIAANDLKAGSERLHNAARDAEATAAAAERDARAALAGAPTERGAVEDPSQTPSIDSIADKVIDQATTLAKEISDTTKQVAPDLGDHRQTAKLLTDITWHAGAAKLAVTLESDPTGQHLTDAIKGLRALGGQATADARLYGEAATDVRKRAASALETADWAEQEASGSAGARPTTPANRSASSAGTEDEGVAPEQRADDTAVLHAGSLPEDPDRASLSLELGQGAPLASTAPPTVDVADGGGVQPAAPEAQREAVTSDAITPPVSEGVQSADAPPAPPPETVAYADHDSDRGDTGSPSFDNDMFTDLGSDTFTNDTSFSSVGVG